METPKGTRDYSPEEKIVRDKIVGTLKKYFELYGFNPLETPALELYDVLASKYAGGSEILKETYSLRDNANRKLGLRYDLTVPLARFIAMNPNVKFPFKRYQIDRVWRDGPVRAGRYREFWQCDIDTIGSKSMLADAEILALASNVLKELNFNVNIRVNNRKLLDSIMESCKIKNPLRGKTILVLDKIEKQGINQVKKELSNFLDNDSIKNLLGLITIRGKNNLELLNKLEKNVASEGIKELKELLNFLKIFKVDVSIDISLARGLSYYTGTIFEIFLKNSPIKSSVAAGGRYDKMIGMFLGKDEVPAVGISFGLDVITDAIKKENKKSVVSAYIIPINTLKESCKILETFRANNINADIDLMSRGISKNLDYAGKLNIPHAIIIGEKELSRKIIKIRDMKTGKEKDISIEKALTFLKS